MKKLYFFRVQFILDSGHGEGLVAYNGLEEIDVAQLNSIHDYIKELLERKGYTIKEESSIDITAFNHIDPGLMDQQPSMGRAAYL